MLRVVHFEVSADDTGRAAKFYNEVFEWKIDSWGGPRDYKLVTSGNASEPGINGGIFKRDGPVNFVNTIEVPDADEYSRKIEAAGGSVVVPKITIPGVGDLVYCQDTEKNVFGILQPATQAGKPPGEA